MICIKSWLSRMAIKEHKRWLPKEVLLMKSIVCSMIGKMILIKSSLTFTKYSGTMLIENYVKHLTIIQKKFRESPNFKKNKGNLLRNKINSNKQTETIAKLKERHNVISQEKALLIVCVIVVPVLYFTRAKQLLLSCLLLILREMNSISGRQPEENYTKVLTNYKHQNQLDQGINHPGH